MQDLKSSDLVKGGQANGYSVVLVKVERAAPLISPVYTLGLKEPAVRNSWLRYWDSLHREKISEPTGE